MESFRKIIRCDRPEKTAFPEHNLMEFLELNGIDKGSITKD